MFSSIFFATIRSGPFNIKIFWYDKTISISPPFLLLFTSIETNTTCLVLTYFTYYILIQKGLLGNIYNTRVLLACHIAISNTYIIWFWLGSMFFDVYIPGCNTQSQFFLPFCQGVIIRCKIGAVLHLVFITPWQNSKNGCVVWSSHLGDLYYSEKLQLWIRRWSLTISWQFQNNIKYYYTLVKV